MLVGAIAGFIASFILTIDKFKVLKDSGYTPSCNINATLNCKSVMLSKQAEVFGFPNSIIGTWFATLLVLSVIFRELLQFKRESLEDEDSRFAVETIQKWMVPFHILWASLLIGAAFLGV